MKASIAQFPPCQDAAPDQTPQEHSVSRQSSSPSSPSSSSPSSPSSSTPSPSSPSSSSSSPQCWDLSPAPFTVLSWSSHTLTLVRCSSYHDPAGGQPPP
ncbi:hypothetical protein NQZ68_034879 [Dissostichus eleginoides]|nr:hypothetical protein NQZ68_034879 [Dissostichus eleginoides]